MPSLYSEHIKEREGFEIVETDFGFASYKYYDQECYIRDVYIKPEFRRSRQASKLLDTIQTIAKSSGCKFITTTVSSQYPNITGNTKAILKYGFEIAKVIQDVIWFKKDII